MSPLKTIFFGTHHFAKIILDGLYKSPLFDVTLVLTQPDKPVGRKQVLQEPPTKIYAREHGIAFDQPSSLKKYTLPACDIGITAQYGLLVPSHILKTPTYGVINVHTSLLPKYRGASPVQSAILNGDQKTGVTIMKMDVGLDTGPILTQKSIAIFPNETTPELSDRLAEIAIPLLETAVPAYVAGTLSPQNQDDNQATTCAKISRADGKINWHDASQKIYNTFRAFTPWPGIWTTWNDIRIKLLDISPSSITIPAGEVNIQNNSLYIGTADNAIQVNKLQLAGKKPMTDKQFIQGYHRIDHDQVA